MLTHITPHKYKTERLSPRQRAKTLIERNSKTHWKDSDMIKSQPQCDDCDSPSYFRSTRNGETEYNLCKECFPKRI